ncbi:MAG TPA: grasp-with-spasm system SPASM domain peptide maturase [Emticicia sp.]
MKKRAYFLFFGNCVIVKGANRSLLIDLQSSRYKAVPNLLVDILKENKVRTLEEIKSDNEHQYDEGIDTYINFFLDDDWGFITAKPEYFPNLSLEWDYPGLISNSIIDIRSEIPDYLSDALKELDTLGCEAVQFRLYGSINPEVLSTINRYISTLTFTYIEVFLKFDDNIIHFIKANAHGFIRFRGFYFYNSPENKTVLLKDNAGTSLTTMRYQKEVMDIHSCGKVELAAFVPDLMLFTESQKHNTCLNRKISIDINGEIKNCPSMLRSYGNIRDTTLIEAIEKAGFKELWYIHKDQIEICKDCEFRHVCTDCRAFIEEPGNIYSKPAKCSYDPYTSTWGDENLTNNPLYGR